MSRPVSRRAGAVDPFIVMDVMAAAAEKEAAGDTVIHLEVGQPSTPAPKAALAAAHAALDSDRIGYVAALGLPPCASGIARHYRDAYKTDVAAERVIVTTGSSGGFPLAFLASFDAGDRVALARRAIPLSQHPGGAQSRGRRSSDIGRRSLPADRGGARESGPIAGLIVASPSNPTGTMVNRAEMKALPTGAIVTTCG